MLLADRHHGLTEGIRGLLESEFPAVVMVADETSLLATAEKMQPALVVADLALTRGESFGWLRRLLARCPESRVIVLSPHDDVSVMEAAFASGAWGYVRRRDLASELLQAATEVLNGKRYSPAHPGP